MHQVTQGPGALHVILEDHIRRAVEHLHDVVVLLVVEDLVPHVVVPVGELVHLISNSIGK